MKSSLREKKTIKRNVMSILINLLCIPIANIFPVMGFGLFVCFNIIDTMVRIKSTS